MRARWENFWFASADPLDLAVARFLFFGIVLIFFQNFMNLKWATVPMELWQPISFFRFTASLRLSESAVQNIIYLWNVATLFACVGFITPVSASVSALLSTYLIGLGYCYGNIHADGPMVIIISFILALSPCANAFSCDAVITGATKRNKEIPIWTFKLIWLVWSLMFFSAALCKLKFSGLSWVTTNNLRDWIIFNHYNYYFRRNGWDIGLFIAQFPRLCQFAAAAVIAMELSVPMILISSRLRRLIVPMTLFFQIACAYVLLVDLKTPYLAYLFFVPWRKVFNQVKKFLNLPLVTGLLVFILCGTASAAKSAPGAFHSKIMNLDLTVAPGVFNPKEAENFVLPYRQKHQDLFKDKVVFEIGTGSGIISLYAGKLGAKKIIASDINPQAIENANLNFKKAGLDKLTETKLVDKSNSGAFVAISETEKFDVIISNPPYSLDLDAKENNALADNGSLGPSIVQGLVKHLQPDGTAILLYRTTFYQQFMVGYAKHFGYQVSYYDADLILPNEYEALANALGKIFAHNVHIDPSEVTFHWKKEWSKGFKLNTKDNLYPGLIIIKLKSASH